ncbi:hypothetical protein LCGC14_3092230, partial [marine sediment metagenome]
AWISAIMIIGTPIGVLGGVIYAVLQGLILSENDAYYIFLVLVIMLLGGILASKVTLIAIARQYKDVLK